MHGVDEAHVRDSVQNSTMCRFASVSMTQPAMQSNWCRERSVPGPIEIATEPAPRANPSDTECKSWPHLDSLCASVPGIKSQAALQWNNCGRPAKSRGIALVSVDLQVINGHVAI